jgi:hypothetical protein
MRTGALAQRVNPSVDSDIKAPAHFMLGGWLLTTWVHVGASESPPEKGQNCPITGAEYVVCTFTTATGLTGSLGRDLFESLLIAKSKCSGLT